MNGFRRPAPRFHTLKPELRTLLLWLGPLLFLLLFYFLPMGSILQLSFTRGDGTTLQELAQTLGSASVRRIVGFTFGQALLATALTLLVGLPGAYLFARFRFRGRSILRALMGIPFVLPTLVVAAAFNALLGPRGWINLGLMSALNLSSPPIAFTNSLYAILLAHIFYNTTIVLRTVGDYWASLDPRLPQAALLLGASPLRSFSRITLPLLSPAIAAAALLVFLFDFTSFGVILLLGGPKFVTLEVEIYMQTVGYLNLPLAAALSVLQLLCTLLMTVVYTRLAARIQRPVERKSSVVTQQIPSGRQRIFTTVILIILVVLLLSPLVALTARSVTRVDPDRRQQSGLQTGLTLDFYRALKENPRQSLFYVPPVQAVRNSLGYAVMTVLFTLIIGLPASWALAYNHGSRLNRLLDPLLMLPVGTSAVTLGLGFLVALDHPPLDLRTSAILIPLAHSLVAFPFVVRSLTPSLRSIQPRLREAASMLGASPGKVFLRIDAPLMGRALLVAAAFAFAISMGEFGATALIARPEYPTIPIVIFRFLSQPGGMNYGQAMALSTILMLVTGSGILAIERLRFGEIGSF
ncbi:MAG: iron ABC transporter permease [Anaerolineales bacterium]|nr:iron ABC transporter permease [Anaerolineales bacterium]